MQKQCETCGGSGEISYFLGESRFLLTTEECPDCMGTGFKQEEPPGFDDPVQDED